MPPSPSPSQLVGGLWTLLFRLPDEGGSRTQARRSRDQRASADGGAINVQEVARDRWAIRKDGRVPAGRRIRFPGYYRTSWPIYACMLKTGEARYGWSGRLSTSGIWPRLRVLQKPTRFCTREQMNVGRLWMSSSKYEVRSWEGGGRLSERGRAAYHDGGFLHGPLAGTHDGRLQQQRGKDMGPQLLT